MRFLIKIRCLWNNLRYLLSVEHVKYMNSILATCQRTERDIGRIYDGLSDNLDHMIEVRRSLSTMTSKIDQLNDALSSTNESAGKILDVANFIAVGAEKNQAELKDILAKLQAGQTDVTPQLEKVIAINDKLASVGTALQSALDEINVTDALYPDIETELPTSPQQPEEIQDGQA